MTIRRHLFLLISSLLLVVALLQISLIFYFTSNIEEEVNRRGKQVADALINKAIENYRDDESIEEKSQNKSKHVLNKQLKRNHILIEIYEDKEYRPSYIFDIPIKSINKKEKRLKLFNGLPLGLKNQVIDITTDFIQLNVRHIKRHFDNHTIEISSKPDVSARLIKKYLKRHIAKIYESSNSDHIPAVADGESEEKNNKVITKERRLEKVINKSFRYLKPNERKSKHIIDKMSYMMIGVIAFTTLLGFILIYVFSNRFSTPLQNLSAGFKELEKGNFNPKVKVEGVEEVKTTIKRFNKMSQRLADLAEAEKKIQQQQHLAEISDISKGIAHALRNPLHTIGLAIEQLESSTVKNETKSKLINRVKNKIIQLDKSIKVLLTITAGEIDRSSSISISSVIHDVILELRQSHDDSKARLTIDLQLDNSLHIIGSNNEIRTVIHTLICNAYEASNMNEINEISIKIKTKKENELVVIYINDQGSGISKEIESTLFQPHVSSKSEGAGMGLYISKRIVEIYYQGELTVTNTTVENAITGVEACCKFKIEENKGGV